MISASGDAEARSYKKYIGKSGKIWCVADQEAAADNIYVDGGRGSQGMAGRTLTFPLSDGGAIELQGPWKTSAGALLKDTGVDLRDTYTSQGIVARFKEHSTSFYGADFYIGVLHHDQRPVVGSFDRVEKIAQRLANERGERLFLAFRSKGGGCAKTVQPQGENDG
jgi:hypothetical protein